MPWLESEGVRYESFSGHFKLIETVSQRTGTNILIATLSQGVEAIYFERTIKYWLFYRRYTLEIFFQTRRLRRNLNPLTF